MDVFSNLVATDAQVALKKTDLSVGEKFGLKRTDNVTCWGGGGCKYLQI